MRISAELKRAAAPSPPRVSSSKRSLFTGVVLSARNKMSEIRSRTFSTRKLMQRFAMLTAAFVALIGSMPCLATEDADLPHAAISPDGVVHIPATAVPLSAYMSEEAKREFSKNAQKSTAADPVNPSLDQQRKATDQGLMPLVRRA